MLIQCGTSYHLPPAKGPSKENHVCYLIVSQETLSFHEEYIQSFSFNDLLYAVIFHHDPCVRSVFLWSPHQNMYFSSPPYTLVPWSQYLTSLLQPDKAPTFTVASLSRSFLTIFSRPGIFSTLCPFKSWRALRATTYRDCRADFCFSGFTPAALPIIGFPRHWRFSIRVSFPYAGCLPRLKSSTSLNTAGSTGLYFTSRRQNKQAWKQGETTQSHMVWSLLMILSIIIMILVTKIILRSKSPYISFGRNPL